MCVDVEYMYCLVLNFCRKTAIQLISSVTGNNRDNLEGMVTLISNRYKGLRNILLLLVVPKKKNHFTPSCITNSISPCKSDEVQV